MKRLSRLVKAELAAKGLKRCCTCKQEKPFGEFWGSNSRADGYHHHCKSCSKQRNRNWWMGKCHTCQSPCWGQLCRKCYTAAHAENVAARKAHEPIRKITSVIRASQILINKIERATESDL